MDEPDADELMRAHFDQPPPGTTTGGSAREGSRNASGLVGLRRSSSSSASCSRCLRHGCSTSPAARASSPSTFAVRSWGSTRALRWSRSLRHACRTRGWSRETCHRCRSTTASSIGSSRASSSTTCRPTDALRSSPRPVASRRESSSSRMCAARTPPRRSGVSSTSTMVHTITCTGTPSQRPSWLAELGGGQVLHEGRWFVVVAAS